MNRIRTFFQTIFSGLLFGRPPKPKEKSYTLRVGLKSGSIIWLHNIVDYEFTKDTSSGEFISYRVKWSQTDESRRTMANISVTQIEFVEAWKSWDWTNNA